MGAASLNILRKNTKYTFLNKEKNEIRLLPYHGERFRFIRICTHRWTNRSMFSHCLPRQYCEYTQFGTFDVFILFFDCSNKLQAQLLRKSVVSFVLSWLVLTKSGEALFDTLKPTFSLIGVKVPEEAYS